MDPPKDLSSLVFYLKRLWRRFRIKPRVQNLHWEIQEGTIDITALVSFGKGGFAFYKVVQAYEILQALGEIFVIILHEEKVAIPGESGVLLASINWDLKQPLRRKVLYPISGTMPLAHKGEFVASIGEDGFAGTARLKFAVKVLKGFL